jgi:protein-tyrosine phosphatase
MRISFVCSGNICRSPMAEVIFRSLVENTDSEDAYTISSRGIGPWHEGQPADPRTVAALKRAGYDGTSHIAHQVTDTDIAENDLLVALDRGHERDLTSMGAKNVVLMTEFDDAASSPDVFDPYHSDETMFDDVLLQIERSCRELLRRLTNE